MTTEWKILWSRLHEPDYLIHVLLPLLTYGLWFGLISLICGMIFKSKFTRNLALLVIAGSGLLMIPYQRHHARSLPVLKANLSAVAKEKTDELQKTIASKEWRFSGLGIVALLALAAAKKPKIAKILTVFVVIAAVTLALEAMGYGLSEWEIYRPELVRPTGG